MVFRDCVRRTVLNTQEMSLKKERNQNCQRFFWFKFAVVSEQGIQKISAFSWGLKCSGPPWRFYSFSYHLQTDINCANMLIVYIIKLIAS